MSTVQRTRVLILGGGFGGLYTALRFERELGRAPEDIRQRFRWLPIGTAVDLGTPA